MSLPSDHRGNSIVSWCFGTTSGEKTAIETLTIERLRNAAANEANMKTKTYALLETIPDGINHLEADGEELNTSY